MRTPPAADTTPRAQPILLQMAVGHPQERVDVIVQKQSTAKAVEELVVQLGGVVTRDLPIINAFTAQLPAKAVPQLARTSGVRWVSLNAPVGGIRDD